MWESLTKIDLNHITIQTIFKSCVASARRMATIVGHGS
jgi:hypothetical protein